MAEQLSTIRIKEKLNNDYVRTVDKSKIPVCNILGVNIAAINMDWLLDYLKKHVKSLKGNMLAGDYICVSNIHTTVTSYNDPEYCAIQNSGIMAIPDGGPLSIVGQKRGHNEMARIAGPNLMCGIFEHSVECCYRHYFYGSTEETLEKLYTELEKDYPGMQIAGMYSPPFRKMKDEEDAIIVRIINDTKPDFVWVGLGAPKQEKWMSDHQGKVDGLMIGVGAGFDYFAGSIDRAPEWMQRFSMEWFYRLIQEPRRLFSRYWKTNWKFIWLVMIRRK